MMVMLDGYANLQLIRDMEMVQLDGYANLELIDHPPSSKQQQQIVNDVKLPRLPPSTHLQAVQER